MRFFTPSRADGRSDRRVIFELVQHAEPDTTFTYNDLIARLSEGLDQPVGRERVYRAISATNKTLLREQQRYLNVVADVGYRVISAAEHLPVALGKKDKAQTYMARGIELLRNVRVNELSQTERKLHEGQLMILGGLYQAIKESDRRHEKSEALIADLTHRVDQLEEQR